MSVGAAVLSISLIMTIFCYFKIKNSEDQNTSFVDIEAGGNFDGNVTIEPEVEVDLNFGIPGVVIEPYTFEIEYDVEEASEVEFGSHGIGAEVDANVEVEIEEKS